MKRSEQRLSKIKLPKQNGMSRTQVGKGNNGSSVNGGGESMTEIAEVTLNQKAYNNEFLDYMKGVVTKGGSTFSFGTQSGSIGGYGHKEKDLKYKRKRLNLDESVE